MSVQTTVKLSKENFELSQKFLQFADLQESSSKEEIRAGHLRLTIPWESYVELWGADPNHITGEMRQLCIVHKLNVVSHNIYLIPGEEMRIVFLAQEHRLFQREK